MSPLPSSVRTDPIRGHRTIVAQERVRRPGGFIVAVDPPDPAPCAFCPGSEGNTPPEVFAFRASGGHANDPTWSVRVVPNQLPALRTETTLAREAAGLYDVVSGVGAHEVIIESPAHVRSLDELGKEPFAAVAYAWQERLLDLQRDFRLRYPVIFRNTGRAAGALLSHAHSQLIALPFVPLEIERELAAFRAHDLAHERCLLCDLLRQESHGGERIVYENESFVVLAPFASRTPFELWIAPKRCEGRFERSSAGERSHFGDAMFTAMRKTNRALDNPALRFALRTAPFGERTEPVYHWRAELWPVLLPVGGFELGTGAAINPVAPETAAEVLRDTLVVG